MFIVDSLANLGLLDGLGIFQKGPQLNIYIIEFAYRRVNRSGKSYN